MPLELYGRKLGMTQIFSERGERLAVTVVQAGPCTVIQKKLPDTDGYSALQLGFEERKEKHTTRPLQGHFRRAGVSPRRVLYEVRMPPAEVEGIDVGQEIGIEGTFEAGQCVDVTGRSIGRGFSGVIRRWGFSLQGRSHGTHEFFRHGGAVSAGSYPGRIFKGKKMAGQLGNSRVTTRNLEIARVDPERNLLFLRGAVPGHRNGLIRVRPAHRPPRG